MNNYISFFKDIDGLITREFGTAKISFQIIGFASLAIAGLEDRGTKDVDTLKTGALADPTNDNIVKFLTKEFGKKSPGTIRHGMYLDIVSEVIPWLPPKPRFLPFMTFRHLKVLRLHPADTCVSKTFSHFKRLGKSNDLKDILDALDGHIIEIEDFITRLDETFPLYECHAEAPELFPKILNLIQKEILPNYGGDETSMQYNLPSWMENM